MAVSFLITTLVVLKENKTFNQLKFIIDMESYLIQIHKFKQQIKAYNDAIKAFEVAKTLADKFDGKVINKRFITALNDAAKEAFGKQEVNFSLYASGYNHIRKQNIVQLQLFLYDRCKVFEGGCVYIGNDRIIVYETNNDGDCYINAEGRLNKAAFLEAMDNVIESCKKEITTYQYCIDNFDLILDKVRAENKRLKELQEEIPFPMHSSTSRIELPFWY